MALINNPFSRVITTKSRYLEAENVLTPLTMITGPEALALAKAGQELIGTNEELIYRYRDEFLHIQRAAENGLTTLNMLVENPSEFGILATAWGFVARVQSRFDTKILYTKSLAATETTTELSNINIDWSKPGKVTIDVDYYRTSGNAVLLEDSTITIPVFSRVDAVKRSLGISVVTGVIPSIDIYYSAGTAAIRNTVNGKNYKNSVYGLAAVIPLTITAGDRYTITYFPEIGGKGYRAGETFTVFGNDLFGSTPDNNAVFTIKEVDAFGAITNISVVGTPGPNNALLQIKLTSTYSASIITLGQFYG